MTLHRSCVKWLSFLLVFLGVTTASAEDASISAKAREHFAAGVSYADDPDGPKWEEACREFQAAYAESPNYQFMNNLGLCALNLERDAESIAAYEGFLAKATDKDIPAKGRKRVERDIQMLKVGLVRIALATTPEIITLVDERVPSKGNPVINRYSVTDGRHTLGIHPGHHKLTASAEGYKPVTWEFDANNAATFNHEFRLERIEQAAVAAAATRAAPNVQAPPPSGATPPGATPPGAALAAVTAPPQTPERRTPTLVYVGAGATGLLAVAATVMGLEAVAKNNDLKAKNDGKHVPEAEGLQKDAKLFALLTDVSMGAALLCAAGTAYLYFSHSSKPAEAPKTGAWRIAPSVGKAVGGTTAGTSMAGTTMAGMNITGEF